MSESPPVAPLVSPPRAIDLLGLRVDDVTVDETRRRLIAFLEEERPHHVVTADASAWVIAGRDPDYLRIVQSADLVTPDGAGLVWAAGFLGVPLRERVSGVDLVEWLSKESAARGFSLFFFGAAPGVAEEAATRLAERYPGMRLAGAHHGFLQTPEEEARLLETIRSARPDVLLIAMGIPRQEKWIARHKDALGARLSMGVGGSFDVFSGRVNRAPLWMQKRGLEWLYRLLQDPRKYSKVANLPIFLANVLLRRRLPSPEPPAIP